MGREVSAFAASDETVKIVAGVDRAELATEYPVYADFSKLTKESADVLIDFSVAPAVHARALRKIEHGIHRRRNRKVD